MIEGRPILAVLTQRVAHEPFYLPFEYKYDFFQMNKDFFLEFASYASFYRHLPVPFQLKVPSSLVRARV